MLRGIIYILLVIYMISAITGIIAFVADVIKWHTAEKKEKIIPSVLLETDESEVNEDVRRDRGSNRESLGESDRDTTGRGTGNDNNYDIGDIFRSYNGNC